MSGRIAIREGDIRRGDASVAFGEDRRRADGWQRRSHSTEVVGSWGQEQHEFSAARNQRGNQQLKTNE